jgi:LmbE family N-acetylglucosaminyl deacetylase
MVTAVGAAAWSKLNADADGLTGEELRALSPMVVLAPHPDDETLGCGGLLATAAAQGLEPRVVYLTDGSASHRQSALWPPSRLAQARRAEALAALSVLGVQAARTLFLDWPDAAPHCRDEGEYGATLDRLSAWLDAFGPKSLWAPRAGETHCDHAAATDLADDLATRRPVGLRRLDYMVWGWADDAVAARRRGERVWRLPCADLALRRRRALACHRTQTTDLIADSQEAFLIPPDLAALTDRSAEIFIERPQQAHKPRS